MVRPSPYFTEEHDTFREAVRRFVHKEIEPHVLQWEQAGGFPREILEHMGKLGYLGVHYAEEVGGAGLDIFFSVVLLEELCRCGAAGFPGAVAVHAYMATPPLASHGSANVKREYLAPAIAGQKVAALAITEPECGSDVAAMRTRASFQDGYWVVNGSKTFITNGCIADFVTTAVRTSGEGHDGISLLVIDARTPGFVVSKRLRKLGWHCSDTAEIVFEDCRVPADRLLGSEGQGFYYLMQNFRLERLAAAVLSVGGMQWLLGQTLGYAQQRQAFGRPIAKFQVLRHTFADLATEIAAARQLTYSAAWLLGKGEDAIADVTMAKLYASELAQRVADRCLQIYGGYGFMEEYPAARAFRDARLGTIGGGTSEIMREILAGILVDGKTHKAPDVTEEPPPIYGKGRLMVVPDSGKPSTCAELFETLPSRLRADKAANWSSRILFEIDGDKGGTFTVHIHDGVCEVHAERMGNPNCTVKTDAATYIGIEYGTVRPEAAFMAGLVKIDNLGEMMKYANCFSRLTS